MCIRDRLKSIGETAFARTNLVSIDIPEGVEWIGEDAFVAAEVSDHRVTAVSYTHLGSSAVTDMTFSKSEGYIACV